MQGQSVDIFPRGIGAAARNRFKPDSPGLQRIGNRFACTRNPGFTQLSNHQQRFFPKRGRVIADSAQHLKPESVGISFPICQHFPRLLHRLFHLLPLLPLWIAELRVAE